MDLILLVVLGVVAIALVTALAPRVGVAGPLALVALGIVVSFLPFVPEFEVEPEWILAGILPPLLYSAAVSLPAVEFRRDFGLIGALSVGLVLISSLVLGGVFAVLVPGLGIALAIGLGAILSPTDAVATSIVRKLGISPRIVTVLEGESLLNDATALVLLSSALAAVTGSFSVLDTVWDFGWAVLLAIVVGAVVGFVNLRVRAWVASPTANTALSFTIPFIAYVPTEHFGGSGLVAAVVAGIVTGQGSARWFTAEQRMSDTLNWRTIELVLEGGVFLIMGLELYGLIVESEEKHQGVWHAATLAAVAILIVLAVRILYVAPLVWAQSRRARRISSLRDRFDDWDKRVTDASASGAVVGRPRRGPVRAPGEGPQHPRRLFNFRLRITRARADLDYYEASPLGWRHGSLIVWAGMRGAVTVAAAQTLPRDTDSRATLLLVAFFVAAGTLLIQGGTLGWVARRLGLAGSGGGASPEERDTLRDELQTAAATALASPELRRSDGTSFDTDIVARVRARVLQPPEDDSNARALEMSELRLAMIHAMRDRLLELRRDGTYSTAALRHSLDELDADELSIQMRLSEGE
ncbi:NhaP-type Na+/H+ and K+/H+ antiporters [Microbacterium sp. C448]|uniref:cation:proton antiporter n=1 Tax=Microbacterium sp. C448 TaxID=1177594 RepID=UPI0003DE5DE0|nr:sodium:proton antiporter [Microbacterium sp. C448]CDK01890.1 NhaP-type Na+/H+ and K+/H+ antiporters [Microbacterium sp. C448]